MVGRGRRGVILDRDGVINVEVGYLHRIEECVFVDGIFPLLRAFQMQGFRLAIATNQAGIGRGYFTVADFQRLMAWMLERLGAEGIEIDAVYHAPDHPTEGIGQYRRDSDWRKPGPGMMIQAIADLALDPLECWAIGDHERDMEAASAAGVGHRIKLDPTAERHTRSDGVTVVSSLSEIECLLNGSQLPTHPPNNT